MQTTDNGYDGANNDHLRMQRRLNRFLHLYVIDKAAERSATPTREDEEEVDELQLEKHNCQRTGQ